MKEPVDHILRPNLPWRLSGEGAITECGYDASKVKTLSREEFFQRIKDIGERRTAMITCMTCSDTAKRWGTWEDDPRKAINREVEWECTRWRSKQHGERLRDELLAIADMIKENQEDFEARLLEIQRRKAWIKQKSEYAKQNGSLAKGSR